MTASDVIVGMARDAVTLGRDDDAAVYDATVPDDPGKRYVVAYPSPSLRTADDLAHTSDTHRFDWQITCVGSTRAEVEWLATRVRDAFVDVRPVVDGLACGVISHDGTQPIRPDTNIPGRVVLYSTDQYSFAATAA